MNKIIFEVPNFVQNMSKKEAEGLLTSLVRTMQNSKEIDVFNNLKDAYDKKLNDEQINRVIKAFACYIKLKSND